MRKARFYAALFTVFMWIGGISPLAPIASTDAAPETGDAHNEAAVRDSMRGTSETVAEHAQVEQATQAHGAADTHGVAGAHDDGHGGKGKQPFILSVDLVSAIVNTIVFLLLLSVLSFFVWPAILKGLQAREAKIRGDLESAERASRDAAASLAQYKQQLADAQREAQRIIDESRTNAQRLGDQLRVQAEEQAAGLRKRAELDIENAKKQAISEVYEEAATLATQVAAQILKREVRPEDHRNLVSQSLQGLATVER